MKKIFNIINLLVIPVCLTVGQSLSRVTIKNSYIVEHGGSNPGLGGKAVYMVLSNGNTNAIRTMGTGWIVSESEFNMLRWYISTNTGSYTIPFGYGSAYSLPVTINIGTAGAGSGYIDFSTYHTLPLNSFNMPSDVANMGPANPAGSLPSSTDDSYQVVDRFWSIYAQSYGTKPALNNINFTYISSGGTPSEVSAPNVFTESSLLAQRFNPNIGNWGDWLGMGGLDIPGGATGSVQSGVVTANNFYKSWTLSSSNSPLPISLSAFTGTCQNGNMLIQWTSQTELNNDYFTVKKTTDNVHFEVVGTIKGAGTSSQPTSYSLTDNSPFAGTSYYILEQTDVNGNTNQVGNLPFAGCTTPVVTTVNAFNSTNNIEIQINSTDYDNFDISIENMMGQIIYHENDNVTLGNNIFSLGNSYSSGIYILSVRNSKLNYTKKLFIGR